MLYILVITLLTMPTVDRTFAAETLKIEGFKSELNCRREAQSIKAKANRIGDVRIIFDHCIKVN